VVVSPDHWDHRGRGRAGQFVGTRQVDTASIDTRDENRDAHLRSADFLSVEKYPKLTFDSTSVTGDAMSWTVAGELTIRDVTKSVSVDVGLEGMVTKDPWGDARMALSGETEINRERFGLTWNVALDTGGVLVGKTVKIDFEIEAVKHD
jgi:polyisoprenoid-binding protein YceI